MTPRSSAAAAPEPNTYDIQSFPRIGVLAFGVLSQRRCQRQKHDRCARREMPHFDSPQRATEITEDHRERGVRPPWSPRPSVVDLNCTTTSTWLDGRRSCAYVPPDVRAVAA